MIMGMNRRGTEKLLSAWWIAMLVLIGGAVIFGVLWYYGADVDVRGIEAEILGDKVVNCFSPHYFTRDLLSDDFDIYERCGLNRNAFGKGSVFFVKAYFEDSNGDILEDKVLKIGNFAYEADCDIKLNEDK